MPASVPANIICFIIFYLKFQKILLTENTKDAIIYTVPSEQNGEVVELVYGTSLENWRRFVAYRGFESHPLRQKKLIMNALLTFYY